MSKIARFILLGYVVLAIAGAILLMLPFSHREPISFLDALFTSSSAISLTGLIVKNTATTWTTFGKLVILTLIQIGGIGYMSLVFLTVILSGSRGSYFIRVLTSGTLGTGLHEVYKMVKVVIIMTVIFEAIGFILLVPKMGTFHALFHSISAFCNAGFSTYPDNLTQFWNSPWVVLTVSFLIVSGGLGVFVFTDLWEKFTGKKRKLMLHTKVSLLMTAILILGAIPIFAIMDHQLLSHLKWLERFLVVFFESITPRTAGFNTIDYTQLSEGSLFITIILMFIGGTAGGTAGGIKVTTLFIVLRSLESIIVGRDEINTMGYRIDKELILKAFLIFTMMNLLVVISVALLLAIEETSLTKTFFEVVSALSTVGLSLGTDVSFAATFSPIGKMIIITDMILGKAGILTFVYSLINVKKQRVRNPRGRIMIG